jgi:hypothetical protein
VDDATLVWPRLNYQRTSRRAALRLLVFSATPLTVDDQPAGLDVTRHDDPSWLDDWRTGAWRDAAGFDLIDAGDLGAAGHAVSIAADLPDPANLGHLQAAWALAQDLVARGAFAVLDATAGRWLDAEQLGSWPQPRAFDLDEEIVVELLTRGTGDFGAVLHTRGMAKFARPDIIALVRPGTARAVNRVVRQLAGLLAEGGTAIAGQRLGAGDPALGGAAAFHLAVYEPGVNAPDLHLPNDALLMLPN